MYHSMQFNEWLPRDGDVLLTTKGCIFYVFGYLHPNDRVIGFLKYIPIKYKRLFNNKIDFLEWQWNLNDKLLVRPSELYYGDILLSILRKHFPEYLYFSRIFNKDILAVPKTEIKTIFVPKIGLSRLLNKEHLDELEKDAVSLITLLSDTSEVPPSEFGIHGSILLGMHNEKSDIDIAVYGSSNFRKVKDAINTLVSHDTVEYLFETKFDKLRRNRGLYNSRQFVINATRQKEEIQEVYGDKLYVPVTEISFNAMVTDNREAMFRPAHYGLSDFINLSSSSSQAIPNEIVCMIGQYRDIVNVGEHIRGKGLLEEVRATRRDETAYRIVIGSGRSNEYIEPF